jgi:hypothetical protein
MDNLEGGEERSEDDNERILLRALRPLYIGKNHIVHILWYL